MTAAQSQQQTNGMDNLRRYIELMREFLRANPNATPDQYEHHAKKVSEELGL